MGVNKTNYNYRNLINTITIGNHLIDFLNNKPSVGPATFSRTMNTYWKFRILSDTNITLRTNDQTIDNNFLGWNISAPNAADNCIGSRWSINGGSGHYTVEYQINQSGPSTGSLGYFCWDLDPLNSTYILCEFEGDSGTNSVKWIINGVQEKYETHTNGSATKVYWNKNTGISEVWVTSNDLDNPSFSLTYSKFVGSYSITNSNDPFFFYSFKNGNNVSNDIIQVNRILVSNFGPTFSYQSLTKEKSLYTPPPTTYMMDQDDKY
jgi:hypothetical protein